jgi:hypothetical protein
VEHLVPIASKASFIMTARVVRGRMKSFFVAFQLVLAIRKNKLEDFGCRGESERIMQIGALCWLRSALIENCAMIALRSNKNDGKRQEERIMKANSKSNSSLSFFLRAEHDDFRRKRLQFSAPGCFFSLILLHRRR